MAVPKRKMSRSNTRSRRAQWKTSVVPTVTCVNPACREPHLSHTACPSCGQYRPQGCTSSGRRGLNKLTALLDELGVQVDTQLFELAFTHRSFAFEHGRIPSNERLEFLGDAVLQIVVTEHIFTSFPNLAEGQLAKLRASVVSSMPWPRWHANCTWGS